MTDSKSPESPGGRSEHRALASQVYKEMLSGRPLLGLTRIQKASLKVFTESRV